MGNKHKLEGIQTKNAIQRTDHANKGGWKKGRIKPYILL